MLRAIQESLWKQFGASIDMLENAIVSCPENHWNTDRKFWYNAYHCLFFLDYYLTLSPRHFAPPHPFTLSEFEDSMPERVYSRSELLSYLNSCRKKCHGLIHDLTIDQLEDRWMNTSGTMDYSIFEILLYNMRHVQHHVGQLNLMLRISINKAPNWVFETDISLP